MCALQDTPTHTSLLLGAASAVDYIELPAGVRSYWFQLSGLPAYNLEYSFTTTETGKKWMRVPSRASVAKEDIILRNPLKIYFRCPDAAAQTVILEYWRG